MEEYAVPGWFLIRKRRQFYYSPGSPQEFFAPWSLVTVVTRSGGNKVATVGRAARKHPEARGAGVVITLHGPPGVAKGDAAAQFLDLPGIRFASWESYRGGEQLCF